MPKRNQNGYILHFIVNGKGVYRHPTKKRHFQDYHGKTVWLEK